jgi:phytoene dehydrogenase-like protein
VELEGGERITARSVVAAINPQTALLRLLEPEVLPRRTAARLRSRHRSNAVQFVVHAALDRLPPWSGAPEGAWNGLQSVADSVEHVGRNFLEAEAGLAPSYPARFADGSSWRERGEAEAHRLLAAVEARAPGFRDTVRGLAWRHAEHWEAEIGLLGGHPMHLDITLDQTGPFRPLPELSDHRAPLKGLYLSGAGTAPGGGVSGVPGRAAARALLADA